MHTALPSDRAGQITTFRHEFEELANVNVRCLKTPA